MRWFLSLSVWCFLTCAPTNTRGEDPRSPADHRPYVVILQGEDEYQTVTTLPKFALEQLDNDYRVSFVWLDEKIKNNFPGIDVVNSADVLLISVRRHPIPAEELDVLKKYVASGKPVIGIRTASHAFHLWQKPAPQGLADWPEFDATVFGGNYTGHYDGTLKAIVQPVAENSCHPILKGIPSADFSGHGSLYKTSPLRAGAVELLQGRIDGIEQSEPVAWTFQRADGGLSFYTSLGHPDDFAQPEFIRLLKNAIDWGANAP